MRGMKLVEPVVFTLESLHVVAFYRRFLVLKAPLSTYLVCHSKSANLGEAQSGIVDGMAQRYRSTFATSLPSRSGAGRSWRSPTVDDLAHLSVALY
jgi:hypothetical protein